jgi:hypothetical protein
VLRPPAAHSSQHNSVALRRRRWPVTECPLIAFAEAMAIVLQSRRRHGWVTEPRMPIDIRSKSLRDVAACRVESIVESALRDFSECGWRGRRGIDNRPRVRTTGKGERQCQYSKCKCFTHFSILEISISRVLFSVPSEALSGSNTDLRRVLHPESILLSAVVITQWCSSNSTGFRNLDNITISRQRPPAKLPFGMSDDLSAAL